MATPIVMPKQGNTVEECVLSEWKVKEGDSIAAGDVIANIETDKAVFEVEAVAGGTVLALFWEEGDLVPVLQNIAVVGEAGEDPAPFRPADSGEEAGPAAAESPSSAESAPAAASASAPPAEAAGRQAPMSPRARRFLAEHPFVVPASLRGSGAGGRIIERDLIEAYRHGARLSPAAAALRAEGIPAPSSGTGVGGMVRAEDMGREPVGESAIPPVSAEDRIEEIKLSNIRTLIASHLHDSLASTAQYTMNAEADATDLLALRQRLKKYGEALGLPDLNIGDMILFAVVKALERHPEVNAEFADGTVRRHSSVHLAFACDTPRGLMVPVVHDAHTLDIVRLAARARQLANEANSGALSPDLLAGGTFTVSNLGAFGITTFTPVINTPQVGILGVGRTILRPVRRGDGVVHREFMQFSLTLNHMVVDGAPGARFLQTLASIVENFDQAAQAR